MNEMYEQHLKDLIDAEMIVLGSRIGPNQYWVCEPPQRRLISWYSTRTFDIPIPWVWYRFEYFSNFKRSYLWEVYFSQKCITDTVYADFPFLPNFYGARPCSSVTTDERITHPIEVINTLWQEGFTMDGRLEYSHVWRYVAREAGVGHLLERPKILEQMEQMNVDSIVRLTRRRVRIAA